jgi:hypothetical protein
LSSAIRWCVTLLISGASKNIVSSSTSVGAMGLSQTRENPTARRHFWINLSHLYNNSGKHKSRNRRDLPWWIFNVPEYRCPKKIVPFFIFFSRCPLCGEWCTLHWLLLDTPSFYWNNRRSLYVYIIYVYYILAIKFLKKVQSFSDTLYYMYERHRVCSCSEPCNDIIYKRIYVVDRKFMKEICKAMRDFRFTSLCTWGFRSFVMLCKVDWQPPADNSAQPIGLTFKYHAVQEDETEESVSDRQPTRHIGP